MIETILAILEGHSISFFSVVVLCYVLYNRYGRGLGRFNGPVLASFTSFWAIYDTWATADKAPYIGLHEKYGNVVRLSPKKLSFAQPEATRDIYGPNGLAQKSDLHLVAQQTSRGEAFQTLFATTNKDWHDRVRRCVNSAFSMTTMVQYEAYTDDTIKVFLQQLEKRFADKIGPEGTVDFPKWMAFFTDDAITNIAYGERIGHLEAGEDVGGILAYMHKVGIRHILFAQMPALELLGRKNPIFLWLQRKGWFNPLPSQSVPFAIKSQQRRRRLLAEKKVDGNSEEQTLTDKFIHAAEANPDTMGDREVLAMALSIIAAGSDSTAISLAAVFYYLIKNPDCYRKLTAEVDAGFASSTTPKSTYSSLPFSRTQQLPYLDACIKEAFRLHPAARWFPERVVPAGGHTICGEYIPAGTVVGVSAWVLHMNADIFGEDVRSYRPERWMGDPEKVRTMDRMLSHFGSTGNYTCTSSVIDRNEANHKHRHRQECCTPRDVQACSRRPSPFRGKSLSGAIVMILR